MSNTPDSEIIFSVTTEELQDEAVRRIGRELTDDELYCAKKGVESGFSTGFRIIFAAAIDESVKIIKYLEKRDKAKN
jgi:type VI protein secretion system component VasF